MSPLFWVSDQHSDMYTTNEGIKMKAMGPARWQMRLKEVDIVHINSVDDIEIQIQAFCLIFTAQFLNSY